MKRIIVYWLLVATVPLHGMTSHTIDSNDQHCTIALQSKEDEGLIAGTLVKIPDGYMAIEQLQPGDCIMSCNDYGILEPDTIVTIAHTTVNEVVQITIAGKEIVVADGHKFFTPVVKRWIQAYQLAHGDTLLSATTNLPIEAITIRQGTFTVFTIATERNHNFFVSENDLLVHNFLPLIGPFLGAVGSVITGATGSVAVGTGGTMAMATVTGTGTLATTGAVPAALATTGTIITTATATATGVASSFTTTLALADAALKGAIAAKGIIAGSLAAKVAPVAAGAIIAQTTNRFLGNNTTTEEYSLETIPTHSRETVSQPPSKTIQQTVIEPTTTRESKKSLLHNAAQEIKKEVALQQGKAVAMDKDMDQELKKETKPREELYIPINISFVDYDVWEDDSDVEDGGEVHYYLSIKTIFATPELDNEDSHEYNSACTELWNAAMYEQQWREGIERIKTHNTSCLMLDVKKGYLDYWMLYKIGDKIHIQEHYLFDVPNQNTMIYTERVGNSIVTPQNCYQFCASPEDRYSNEPDEYGLKASEWVVPIIKMKRSTV